MKKIILSMLVLSIFIPSSAFAAWTATENFDNYGSTGSGGISFHGFNGGKNWTTPWNVDGNAGLTEPSPYTTANSMSYSIAAVIGASSTIDRNFTPISSGIFHIKFYNQAILQGRGAKIFLRDTSNIGNEINTNRAAVYLNDTGELTVDASDGQTFSSNITTYLTQAWHTIDIKFDKNLGNVFQVSVDGGAYSTNFNSGGSLEHIDQIMINVDELGGAFLVDDIGTTDASGSGTINRLAKFVDNSNISNALFSDDGVNTTLTSGNLLIPTGNVGIGTTTPIAKLHVNGDLFANFINLTANSFGLDTLTTGTLSIGSTTANAINIGRNNATTTISGPLVANSTATLKSIKTSSNCASSASPAVCGSAPAGSVAMPTGGSTIVVNTSAVTANSVIMVTENSWMGTRLGITCNTANGRRYNVSAVTPGVSFTIESSANPTTNKACLSYLIVN